MRAACLLLFLLGCTPAPSPDAPDLAVPAAPDLAAAAPDLRAPADLAAADLRAPAADLAPGALDILVTAGGALRRYHPDGTFVSSLTVPYPGPDRTEGPRTAAVDGDGRIHVYNGTFAPYLSTYDPRDGSWVHHDFPGWSTVNNVAYGGVVVAAGYAFVTDMVTAGKPEAGLVRFRLSDFDASRPVSGKEFSSLSLGVDGLLYAVGTSALEVYDPATLALKRTVRMDTGLGWIVPGPAAGELLSAGGSGYLFRYDLDGKYLGSVRTALGSNMSNLVRAPGLIVAGGWENGVLVTDDGLGPGRAFNVAALGNFVALVPR